MPGVAVEGVLREYEPMTPVSIDEYEQYVGSAKVEEVRRLAAPLVGTEWAHVNSTFLGGGVAEILRSLVPLARGVGLDAHWYAIPGTEDFFHITKTFHNLLQGLDHVPVDKLFDQYLETSRQYGKAISLSADVIQIHDPQPLAMVLSGTLDGAVLWRCHIDTSAPDPELWRRLLPYINQCEGAIFTMPDFIGPGVTTPVHLIAPAIDPLSPKNHLYSHDEALSVLEPLFREHRIDPERPILAAISRYDVHKNQRTILKAYARLVEKNWRVHPYLIFLGNTALDDPEGEAMLMSLREMAEGLPDVHLWVNVPDNDRVVGALMKIARAFVHVSTREGFGLVVSEALWQGTPVIGSRAGGITEQVIDGQTGYLVDALDEDQIADRMAALLEHPEDASRLGEQGREHVRAHFLMPELLRRYLAVLRFHSNQRHVAQADLEPQAA